MENAKQRFLKRLETAGISIEDTGAYLDEYVGIPFAMGIYLKDGKWNVYENGERNFTITETFDDADAAYDHLYDIAMMHLS